jgi:hypothetical protein
MICDFAVILESREYRDVGRSACRARLEFQHPELWAARLPTVIEITLEAAILSVDAPWEPRIQHGHKCILEFCDEVIVDSRNGRAVLVGKVYWHVVSKF